MLLECSGFFCGGCPVRGQQEVGLILLFPDIHHFRWEGAAERCSLG